MAVGLASLEGVDIVGAEAKHPVAYGLKVVDQLDAIEFKFFAEAIAL
jgi:hypothetical protein